MQPQQTDHPIEHHGAIGSFLRSPAESADLIAFSARFQARRISVKLADMAAAACNPALIGRLRGALGEALVRTASPEATSGRPCPWHPQSAFEALFRKQGRMTPGTDFPSPWVLAVQPRRGALNVELTLFGVACEWAPAAAEALVEACARLDWRAAAGVFVPAMTVLDRRMQHIAVADRAIVAALELEFLSPLVVSSQNPVEAPAAAFKSLRLRLEGLARWHGLTLSAVDWDAVGAALRAAEWSWSDIEFADWRRGSRRQDRWIAMSGVLGRLHITATADAMCRMAPLFRIGATTHVGADIAFGCGRYRIVESDTPPFAG